MDLDLDHPFHVSKSVPLFVKLMTHLPSAITRNDNAVKPISKSKSALSATLAFFLVFTKAFRLVFTIFSLSCGQSMRLGLLMVVASFDGRSPIGSVVRETLPSVDRDLLALHVPFCHIFVT